MVLWTSGPWGVLSWNVLQEENLGAINVKLSPEDLTAVREVAEGANATQGDRYPPAFMEVHFADTPAL